MTRPSLLVTLFLVASACGGHSGPKAVLTTYLEAEQAGRYDAAHQLLTADDQRARSLDAYVAEHLSAGPIWLAVARRTRFTVGAVDNRDDHVRVAVTATHQDMKSVEKGLAGVPIERIETSPDPAAAMFAYVEGELNAQAFPEVQESITYALREQDGTWRVWLGLDRQDAAIRLTRTALVAMDHDDDSAALVAWNGVLALEEDPSGVVASLKQRARDALVELEPVQTPPVPTDVETR